MSAEDLKHFRALLDELGQDLIGGLETHGDSAEPVSPDRAIGRLTRQDAILAQQMALEIRRRNKLRLEQVQSALRRIDEGTYGLCLRCEEEISIARLKFRPEAALCIRCASGRP